MTWPGDDERPASIGSSAATEQDNERGTIRIKVTDGRWLATHVERSGGGGRHSGADD